MVNFTASSYDIEANETTATVRVQTFGEFRSPFLVNVTTTAPDVSERSMTIHLHLHYIQYMCTYNAYYLCCNCFTDTCGTFISVQLKLSLLRKLWKCYFQLPLILL